MFCCEYIKNLQSFFKGANHSHICSALEPKKIMFIKVANWSKKSFYVVIKNQIFLELGQKRTNPHYLFFVVESRHQIQIFLVISFPIHRCIVDNYNPRNSHVKNNTMLMGCNSINVKFTSLSFII